MDGILNNLDHLKDTIQYAKENYSEQMSNISEQIDLLIESMFDDVEAFSDTAFKKFKNTQDFGAYRQLNTYITKMEQMINTLKDASNFVLPDFSLDDEVVEAESATEQSEEENIRINYNDKRYQADISIPHTLYENFTYTRPVMVEIDGERIDVSEWKEMFRAVCEYLFKKNPKTFYSFLADEDMHGKKRVWFSTNPKDVVSPMLVEGSNIYIMGNVSAMFVRNIIIKMFEKYSIPKHKCKIYIGRNFSELHTTATIQSNSDISPEIMQNLPPEAQSIIASLDEETSKSQLLIRKEKIGQYARRIFEEYFKNDISADELSNFLNKDWCHDTLGICYPLLKKVDPNIPLSNQIGYNNKYSRYWIKEVPINGDKYLLCSQWFEDDRPKLDAWIATQESISSIDDGSIAPTYTPMVLSDIIYFDGKVNGFHLKTDTAIGIFKYISSEYKRFKRIDTAKIAEKFAVQTEYERPSYFVRQIITRLLNHGVIALCDGCKRKYYRVIDQDKLSVLISNPLVLKTGQWVVQHNTSDITVHVIGKANKKNCVNCSNGLEKYRLKYNVYTDMNKTTTEFEREIQAKRCPNCKKIFITEGTYNAVVKQQRSYIERSNLKFVK